MKKIRTPIIGYVYVVDFGDFRKVGASTDPAKRIFSISKDVDLTPISIMWTSHKDSRLLEKLTHEMIKNEVDPTQKYKRESFSTQFHVCVDALCCVKDILNKNWEL